MNTCMSRIQKQCTYLIILLFFQVCIDGHTVDIIAADGTPVQPYTTNCFIIFPAERYDVIVEPDTPGDYLIRFSTTDERTALSSEPMPEFPHFGYAIMRVGSDGGLLAGFSPPSCNNSTALNCGEEYVSTCLDNCFNHSSN